MNTIIIPKTLIGNIEHNNNFFLIVNLILSSSFVTQQQLHYDNTNLFHL